MGILERQIVTGDEIDRLHHSSVVLGGRGRATHWEAVEDLRAGDFTVVRLGEQIPADCRVVALNGLWLLVRRG